MVKYKLFIILIIGVFVLVSCSEKITIRSNETNKTIDIGPRGGVLLSVSKIDSYQLGTIKTDPPGIECGPGCQQAEYMFPLGTEVDIIYLLPDDLFEVDWVSGVEEMTGALTKCSSISGLKKETCTMVLEGGDYALQNPLIVPVLKSAKGSKECVVTARDPNVPTSRDLKAILTGTVSGPVGSMLGDVFPSDSVTFSCESWTPTVIAEGILKGNLICVRIKDDPPSTTWRFTDESNKYSSATEVLAVGGPYILSYNTDDYLISGSTSAYDYYAYPHGSNGDGFFIQDYTVSCPQ